MQGDEDTWLQIVLADLFAQRSSRRWQISRGKETKIETYEKCVLGRKMHCSVTSHFVGAIIKVSTQAALYIQFTGSLVQNNLTPSLV